MDWNADGKKDLLTGEYFGTIRIYLNVGTDAAPEFNGYTLVQQGGQDFYADSYSSPCVVDWNNDTLFDLLCGEAGGNVWLLINTGTPGSPLFETKEYLKDGSSDLNVGITSTPDVVDWNLDGKKDLVVGNFFGDLPWFENKGTDSAPVFDGSVPLPPGAEIPIQVGLYSRPFFVDWDEDGTTDVICGDVDGYVWYFQGLGPLYLNDNQISDATGGTITLKLNAGPSYPNRAYILLGSISGTQPGITLPGGEVLPLVWDPFTDLVLSLLNTPIFDKFVGVLNAQGTGQAHLYIPPGFGLAGITMHFAYCLGKPFNYVSNPAPVEIVP